MSAWYIKTRKEFFEVLDRAIAETDKRIQEAPDFDAFDSVREQLEAMKKWTAGGRTPTEDEQQRIDIALIAVRELDPEIDAAMAKYHELLVQLDGYFCEWPDDEPGGP